LLTADVSWIACPGQSAMSSALIETVAVSGTIVTGALVALQAPSVTVTLYVPDDETVIDCVVAPFDQSHDVPDDAASVTVPD
jgi:hypothetical protein